MTVLSVPTCRRGYWRHLASSLARCLWKGEVARERRKRDSEPGFPPELEAEEISEGEVTAEERSRCAAARDGPEPHESLLAWCPCGADSWLQTPTQRTHTHTH